MKLGKALFFVLLILLVGHPAPVRAQTGSERAADSRVLQLLEPLPLESGHPGLALREIQPNPFSSSTTIHFTLPENSPARLRIFDLMGGLRAELPVGPAPREVLRVQLNATGWPNGVYLASLDHKGTRQVKKLILAR